MNVPIPAQIGKYQVLERLAIGGMAELFKARIVGDHGFEKLVAIKRILPHLAEDPAFVSMFVDEARFTARLDHPHIVQVFELGDDDGVPFIAMQFVDGFDVLGLLLACARAQRRLPVELAALVAHQVLDALDHAHRATDPSGAPLSIVHRDVSPGNVLVSRRGDVKLTDFGILWAAVERKQTTEAGVLKGKYGYMSPEQVLGGEIDHRSDVFSAGTLLAEMITMRRLFAAPSDLDVLLLVRDARLDRLDEFKGPFPVELRAICERALQRQPARRWASAGAFRDALGEWLWANGRPSARDLAELIAQVTAAPGAPAAASRELSGTPGGAPPRKATERASRGRVTADLRPGASARASAVLPEDDGEPTATSTLDAAGLLGRPTEADDLRNASAMRIMARIAHERRAGLLVLDSGAGVLKEAYFADGHPQFVASNVASERLGEFLVAQRVISPPQLAQALAAMPEFGNNLADTLVGLGVLRPLDALRLLARQVGAKLSESCSWQKGRWRWYADRVPAMARPLHLDVWKVLGAGATQLELRLVEDWLASRAGSVAAPVEPTSHELERFGLGEAPARVHKLFDGRTPLGALAQRLRTPEARANFLRLVYLLVECELATLR